VVLKKYKRTKDVFEQLKLVSCRRWWPCLTAAAAAAQWARRSLRGCRGFRGLRQGGPAARGRGAAGGRGQFTRAGSASLVRGSVSCPWLCVRLPVASRRAGHTGARFPPSMLASSFDGGAVGDASLGDTVDFFGGPPMPEWAGRRVGNSPALATP
jgi:hypothetical protein